MVQFRAMVTPCMPTCPPVVCDVLDYTGQSRQVESYGRKKRWTEPMTRSKRQADSEEVLVVQTLRIVDKNKALEAAPTQPLTANVFDRPANVTRTGSSSPVIHETSMLPTSTFHKCVEENTLISGAVIFLVIQVIILSMFVFLWKKKRENHAKEVITPPESTTDSLSYMYESGFTRRLQ